MANQAETQTDVPGVLDNVPATPMYIKVGAAILLGFAFGVGCYVWSNGGVPSAPQHPERKLGVTLVQDQPNAVMATLADGESVAPLTPVNLETTASQN